MCTAISPMSSPRTSHSSVCNPARTPRCRATARRRGSTSRSGSPAEGRPTSRGNRLPMCSPRAARPEAVDGDNEHCAALSGTTLTTTQTCLTIATSTGKPRRQGPLGRVQNGTFDELRTDMTNRLEHPSTVPPITQNLTSAPDVHQDFAKLLDGVGLDPKDTGGEVTFTGADPILPSKHRLGAIMAMGMMGPAVAMRGTRLVVQSLCDLGLVGRGPL